MKESIAITVRKFLALSAGVVAGALLFQATAHAFPDKPIRLIGVGFETSPSLWAVGSPIRVCEG